MGPYLRCCAGHAWLLGAACMILGHFSGPAAAADAADSTKLAELQTELDGFVKDYNDLFPARGVWLSVVYTREQFPGMKWKQIQKFAGVFNKTPRGDYEQLGTCESDFYNGNQNYRTDERTVHRLTIENGRVVLYSAYNQINGQRNEYGPSAVTRLGNSIAFREISTSTQDTSWEMSTFYRKRDGQLTSSRHWKNAPWFEHFTAIDPPLAEKPE